MKNKQLSDEEFDAMMQRAQEQGKLLKSKQDNIDIKDVLF